MEKKSFCPEFIIIYTELQENYINDGNYIDKLFNLVTKIAYYIYTIF